MNRFIQKIRNAFNRNRNDVISNPKPENIIENIFSWKDIKLTLLVFLATNGVFWFVIQSHIRFYGICFLFILIKFIMDTFWETNMEYTKICVDFIDICHLYWDKSISFLTTSRKNNQASFSIGMSVVLLLSSFITSKISGAIIIYFVILGVFFIPLISQKYLEAHLGGSIFTSNDNVLAEEELIPVKIDLIKGQIVDRFISDSTSLLPSLTYFDFKDDEIVREEDLVPSERLSTTVLDSSSESDSGSENFFNRINTESYSKELEKNVGLQEDSSSDSEFEIIHSNEVNDN